LIIIGIACLAFAVVLAWLSSLTTMRVVRTSPATADVAFEDKLFGLVVISRDGVAGVRSARTVIQDMKAPLDTAVPGQGTTARLLQFDTGTGAVFAGPGHHYFARYADEITAFVADPDRTELVASVAAERSELVRFLFAQACVLLLAAVGGLMAWSGARKLLAGSNARIGPA
jgi:hypothetical protein